jgi:hypothetical protein
MAPLNAISSGVQDRVRGSRPVAVGEGLTWDGRCELRDPTPQITSPNTATNTAT